MCRSVSSSFSQNHMDKSKQFLLSGAIHYPPKTGFFLDEAEKKEKEQLLQKSAGAWAASNHCQEKIVLKIQCVALWVACGLAPLPSRDQCNIGAAVFPECFSSVALSQETEYLRPQT